MSRILKRWELHATPFAGNPLSAALAADWNIRPERFWTRRRADRAARFYTVHLQAPVTFWVLDRKDTGSDD